MNTHVVTHPDQPERDGTIPRSRMGRRIEKPQTRMTSAARPRRLPYLLVGMLLVLGCTAGGVVVATSVGNQEPVLVLARPVTVGQVLSDRDLREESVAASSRLRFIPVRSKSSVEGRPVAYSLPEGAPLTRNVLGAAHVPPAGQAVAAVGLKAGQFPPGVQSGNRVAVVVVADNGNTASSTSTAWDASVTDVRRDATDQAAVISLLMAEGDARRLAAAPAGQISVVMVHGGGQ
ncbi:SAF domain-containing protein [Streptomyces sp. NPDC057253]|uniref:SAF domain-containing protein n=1 Tax=Streptomyces sp. NPDC057253 TaxID=3346069 RepID=UPI00362D5A3A